MRKWINLFESECTTVYHGGTEIIGNLSVPFFVSPVQEMSQGYAEERGRDIGAHLYAFDFCPSKVCNYDDFTDFLLSIGIEHDDTDSMPHYIDPNVGDPTLVRKVLDGLLKHGYDAVFFYDFGFHADFEEFPAYAVLNTATLSNKRLIKKYD